MEEIIDANQELEKEEQEKFDIDEEFDSNPDSETLDLSVEGDDENIDISSIFTLNSDLDNDKTRIELINELRYAAQVRMIFTVEIIGCDERFINGKKRICLITRLDPPLDTFEILMTFESFFTELEKIRFKFEDFPDDAKRRRLMEYFGSKIEICISRLTYSRRSDTLLILGNRPLALSRIYRKFYERGVWTGLGYDQHKIKVNRRAIIKGCRVIRMKPDFVDMDICGIPYTMFTNDLSWKFISQPQDICEIGDLLNVRIIDIRWMVMAKNDLGEYREFDITDRLKNITDEEEIERIEQIDYRGFKTIKLKDFKTYRYRSIVASVKMVEDDYTLPVLEEYSKPEKLGYTGETLATVVGMNNKTGRVRMYCEIGYNAVAKVLVKGETELPGNISARARRRRDVIPGSRVIFRPRRRSEMGDFMEGEITRVIKR